jgi:hypothetical protein
MPERPDRIIAVGLFADRSNGSDDRADDVGGNCRHLGEPKSISPNPHGSGFAPMRCWNQNRVVAAEATPAVRKRSSGFLGPREFLRLIRQLRDRCRSGVAAYGRSDRERHTSRAHRGAATPPVWAVDQADQSAFAQHASISRFQPYRQRLDGAT